jgi:hypothetical protein
MLIIPPKTVKSFRKRNMFLMLMYFWVDEKQNKKRQKDIVINFTTKINKYLKRKKGKEYRVLKQFGRL